MSDGEVICAEGEMKGGQLVPTALEIDIDIGTGEESVGKADRIGLIGEGDVMEKSVSLGISPVDIE